MAFSGQTVLAGRNFSGLTAVMVNVAESAANNALEMSHLFYGPPHRSVTFMLASRLARAGRRD
jgi:hypothetical protein